MKPTNRIDPRLLAGAVVLALSSLPLFFLSPVAKESTDVRPTSVRKTGAGERPPIYRPEKGEAATSPSIVSRGETAPDAPPIPSSSAAMKALPTGEQESLWSAFSEARRSIQTLAPHEAALERNRGVHHFAQNPGQRLTARFLDQGARVESGRGDVGWSATFTSPGLPAATEVTAKGTKIEYLRGTVTEWFENQAEGFEHGYVVHRPLDTGKELRLSVQVEGLQADVSPESPGSMHLSDQNGETRLCYDKLLAWDATGSPLPARMEARPEGIDLVINVATASYPVTIDPLISTLEQKLLPEITGDGSESDAFGVAVSLDGDTALIGASLSDTPTGSYSGYAYVFTRSANVWTMQARLTGTDTNDNDRFGSSVSLDGNTALIGSPLDDPRGSNSGSAYIFVRNGTTWSQQAKFVPPDGASNDNFGESVSLSGPLALIGAESDSTAAGTAAGSAYVYVRNGSSWSLETKLEPNDPAPSDYFGSSVTIDGGTAVVGARLDDDRGSGSGSAYVFTRSGTMWTQQAKLTASDGTAGDALGVSASLSGNDLILGASQDGVNGTNSGSAYVFTRSSGVWTEQGKLLPSDGSSTSLFGSSVAVEGNTALVGAHWQSSLTGAAYVFTRNGSTWQQATKLTASDKASGANFGHSVSLSGETALVGAASGDTVLSGPVGGAYVFQRNSGAWNETTKLSLGGDNASGDGFGGSVAIQGNRAVIGASDDNTAAGSDVGSAYVFTRSGTTWTMEAHIYAADGTANDSFGSSISLDNDTIVAGAILDDVNDVTYSTGSAYVFVRNGSAWIQQAKLSPGDVDSLDYFGCGVSVDGDLALIGSYWDRTRRGSAYIFARNGNTWTQQAKLIDPDGRSEDNLGLRVSLSGTTALVSALSDDDLGNASGSVFVFTAEGTTWSQQAKLHASDGTQFRYFGSGVSLSGNTALIGASGGSGDSTYAGAAYVFTRTGSTWTQHSKLQASDASAEDFFGSSVAIDGNIAVIGAERDSISGATYSGSAYVFQFNGTSWQQHAKLTSNSVAAFDFFGAAVAISGDTALIGAHGDDGVGLSGNAAPDQGSVHVFRLAEPSSAISVFLDVINQPLIAGGEAREVFRATVSNTGAIAATGVTLQTSGLPAGAEITSAVASSGSFANGTWSLNLPARHSATLVLSVRAGAALTGSVPISLALTNATPADITPANNSANASVPVVSAQLAGLQMTVSPTLQPQNGLWVGQIRITNQNEVAVPAFRVYVTNLPPGVTLQNAHGTGSNGLPYLLYNLPLAPGASINLAVELFSSTRTLSFTPSFEIEVLAVPQFVPSAGTSSIAVTKLAVLSSGDILVEINSTPGTTYVVDYSNDAQSWIRASGSITAVSNRLQWIDNGPPKTQSHPSTVGSRFYRFVEVTPGN